MEGVIKSAGSVEVDGGLQGSSLSVESGDIKGLLNVGTIQVSEGVTAESVTCSGTITTSNGLVVQSGEVTVTGPVSSTSTVSGKDGTFEGVLKSQSVMTARVYTDDFTASGFVSAGVVKSKGDVEAMGMVKGKNVEAEVMVKAPDVEVENKVKAVLGEFGGMVKAGAVDSKRFLINGGEVDVGATLGNLVELINQLFERVQVLEGKVEGLEKNRRGETAAAAAAVPPPQATEGGA